MGRIGRYGRMLAPAAARPSAILEVVIGMVVIVGICYAIRPADPILLGIGFPWIWLAATVFAVRYGASLGVLAGLCIAVAWALLYGTSGDAEFPTMLFVGGFAQLVITGHFCDVWANRMKRMQSAQDYLDDRLASLTNNHYLLRISHQNLERTLLTQPSTLRDAVRYLRDLPVSNAQDETLPNAQSMLEFAARSCQLGAASVFCVSGNGPKFRVVASVGESFALDADDPLVRECLEQRVLVHLRHIDNEESAYLACVPIISASQELMGILVVRLMPFLSLNFDNLQLLLVLLSYYADSIEQQEIVTSVQAGVSQCPYEFALEIGRLGHMQQISGVPSSLVALVFPHEPLAESLLNQVLRQHRALDLRWTFNTEHAQVLITLMPLTDENGISGYLLRLEDEFRKQFDTNLTEAHVAVHIGAIDANLATYGLEGILERCGYRA
ncbi:hypothetical protein H0A69_20065 [Eoetvoesia caeni]|nr:PelD GGDEF domain-containing protein [Eoetvoesiella caeni]NYT56815.1 hypothetical protein [Eoetvoesiella caeni]